MCSWLFCTPVNNMISIIDVIKTIFSMRLFAYANVYLWVNMTRNDRKTKSLNWTVRRRKKTKQIARQIHEPVDSLRILWAPLELLFSILFFFIHIVDTLHLCQSCTFAMEVRLLNTSLCHFNSGQNKSSANKSDLIFVRYVVYI